MGRHVIDTTCKTFGSLTVLQDDGGGKIYVRCRCGRECWKAKNGVLSGNTKTCGVCNRHGQRPLNVKSVVARRFGSLTVAKDNGGETVLCHCDCGKDVKVKRADLVTGAKTHCGCQTVKPTKKYSRVGGTCIGALKNTAPTKRSSSGVRGVYRRRNKWAAMICLCGEEYHLGTFATKEEAAAARRHAEETIHKDVITAWKQDRL